MNSRTTDQTGYLTNDRRALLQDAILKYGSLVRYEQLRALLPDKPDGEVRRIVSRLTQSGWLVRIQKGLYEIADLASLGSLTLSRYVVAQLLLPGSYVTDENALQHHGLHDQLMRSLFSAAVTRRKPATVAGITYHFIKIDEAFRFGFDKVRLGEHTARIAHVEKALLDMIQLQRSDYAVDRVGEVLAQPGAADMERLSEYLQRAALPTQRIFGFLLETLDLPVADWLLTRAHASKSVTRLTRQSATRSARWRLYYDPHLVERIRSYIT
jgi:predicted transcriptional regulator of viral defense system